MFRVKPWLIASVADSAYRHGQGYAQGKIYRHANKFCFKCPEAIGLPNWILQCDMDEHKWIADIYKHAFRQGLKQSNAS